MDYVLSYHDATVIREGPEPDPKVAPTKRLQNLLFFSFKSINTVFIVSRLQTDCQTPRQPGQVPLCNVSTWSGSSVSMSNETS